MSLMSFVFFTLFVLAVVAAVYFFRLSVNLRAILREGASKFNQQTARIEALLGEIGHLKKTQVGALEAERSAQKAVKFAEFKTINLQTHNDELQGIIAQKERNFELQKEFLVKDFEKERKTYLEDLARARDSEREKQQVKTHPLAVQQLKDRIDILQKDIYERDLKIRELEHKSKTAQTETEAKLAAISPDKVASVKRRAAHYERLYVSMKSYREMSEDRLQNWETALRKLSLWVLEHNQKPVLKAKSEDAAIDGILNEKANPKGPLGPIVGLALETIGTGFIDEQSA